MSLADVNDEQQADVDELEEQATEQPQGQEAENQEPEAEGVVVTIGDESPPSEEVEAEAAPEWVRNLRKEHREEQRRRRDLEKKLEELTKPKPAEVGPMPTFEDADVDYDTVKFAAKYDSWKARKDKADADAAKQQEQQQESVKAFQARKDAYDTGKAALKVQDFDDAESSAIEHLDQLQQNILIAGAENTALLVYALGKNPAEAKKLAAIKDPVQFAFAAARLENKLKVTPRKAAPLPEGTVRGTAPVRSSDQNLARLEAEAEKTSDYTKVIAYKRKLKAAATK